MIEKHHTVILVPHNRARLRRWRFTTRQIVVAVSVLGVALVVALLSLLSLFSRAVDQHHLATLAEENRVLRQANQEFETNLRDLRSHLTEIEQRTQELAIVAGVDGLDGMQESGVGGADLGASYLGIDNRLDEIETRLDERRRLIAATPTISPVRGLLTSGFGLRADPLTGEKARHLAIDLSTAPGRPVVATANGIVLKAERNGPLGNMILLSHGFGFTTRYGHLSRFSVETGQRVERGQVIGYVGNTGRATGFHLHYEVRIDGKPVDPLGYMLDSGPRGIS